MDFGVDRLAREIGEMVAADVRARYDGGAWKTDSPIEALFLAGVLGLATHVSHYQSVGLGLHQGIPEREAFGPHNILIGAQIGILDFRADFLLSVIRDADQAIFRLVVECDGHDFHERTKEQAARDRSRDRRLVAAGFTVMRFTGSELYRDPVRCVREALDWCSARAWEVPHG